MMQVTPPKTQSAARAARLRFALQMAEQAQRVGDRIQYERKARDWSRPQMARELTGLATPNDVYRWERGKHMPRLDTLEAIAKLFEIEVADLYAGVPHEEDAADLSDALKDAEPDDRFSRIETKLDQVLGLLLEQETRGAAEGEQDGDEKREPDAETGS